MTERKRKTNTLDLVIVIALLCIIAVLIFHDIIDEYFGVHEYYKTTCTVGVENAVLTDKILGRYVGGEKLYLISGSSMQEVTVLSCEYKRNSNIQTYDITLVLSLDSYYRDDSSYAQSGLKLVVGESCGVSDGDAALSGTISAVNVSGTLS